MIYISLPIVSCRFTSWSFLRQHCEMLFRNIDSAAIDTLTAAYYTVIAGEMFGGFRAEQMLYMKCNIFWFSKFKSLSGFHCIIREVII